MLIKLTKILTFTSSKRSQKSIIFPHNIIVNVLNQLINVLTFFHQTIHSNALLLGRSNGVVFGKSVQFSVPVGFSNGGSSGHLNIVNSDLTRETKNTASEKLKNLPAKITINTVTNLAITASQACFRLLLAKISTNTADRWLVAGTRDRTPQSQENRLEGRAVMPALLVKLSENIQNNFD